MAAYIRSVKCLFSAERSVFLSRGSSGVTVEVKRYVRGLRRKPVRVLWPEDEVDKAVKAPPPPPTPPQPAGRDARRLQEEKVKHSERVTATDTAQSAVKHAVIKDQVDGIRFEKAFPGDKRLARLASVARSRTFREHQGKVLLEGRRLICDALDAGAKPQTVFFSSMERLRELPLDKLTRAALVKVKFEEIKIWSDVVAPQGVIAIFARPDPSRLTFSSGGLSVPLSLICDNVRDPGNLGTMLRCAAAAGCHNVLLTKGCVDAWEPKVLRAAMGAHFRLPIFPSLDWSDVDKLLPHAASVHVADSSHHDAPKPSKAGDFGWISSNRSHARYEDYDSDSDSEPRLDSVLYHEGWARSPAALVIGGETHGVSGDAVRLAERTGGQRLFIPVTPGVDSLNSAMAASILLFEGRKQLLAQTQTQKQKQTQTAGRKTKTQQSS